MMAIPGESRGLELPMSGANPLVTGLAPIEQLLELLIFMGGECLEAIEVTEPLTESMIQWRKDPSATARMGLSLEVGEPGEEHGKHPP